MIIGEYITRLSGLTQYGPIFGRGGQGANFVVECLDVPGGGVLLGIVVEHKNSDDTSWTTLVSFATFGTTGLKSANATAIKEQLRFTFAVSAGASPQVYDTFYVNILAPQWRP